MKPSSVGRSKLVAVARLLVFISLKNDSGMPNTIATMSLNSRTCEGSPPAPVVLNASSLVPGPDANTLPSTAVGLRSSHELLGPAVVDN